MLQRAILSLMMAWLVRKGPGAWLVVVLLAGCSSNPPSDPCGGIDGDEVGGVAFRSHPFINSPVLIGETRTFDLIRIFNGGPEEYPFEAPATIMDTTGSVSFERTGSSLVVQAVHDGSANITLVADGCPDLRGGTQLDVRAVEGITLLPGDKATYVPSDPVDQIPPGVDVAFARESSTQVGIGLVTSLRGEVLLIDQDTQVTPPDGAQLVSGWGFDDSALAEGAYGVEVTAGSATFTTPFVIVDHAETITAITQDLTVHSYGLSPCFAAMTANRYVASLKWTFTLDGSPAPIEPALHNCAYVLPQNDLDHDGKIVISATAGGFTAQFVAQVLP